ncbi:MAG: D-amino acid aminotransferase [Gammaproteobacteria bacterium]
MSLVYLNGDYVELEQARVNVLDRGFTFADAVYEVIPVFNGSVFRFEEHIQRLDNSLREIYMENPLQPGQWQEIFKRLTQAVATPDQSIYLQVTRGVTERDHDIDLADTPTVFVMSRPLQKKDLGSGIKVITHDDIRWSYCHIKATTLLASVLLRHRAKQQGAKEAILIREGHVTEGAASNVFIVKDNIVYTSPSDNEVLPGITRALILELLQSGGIEFREEKLPEAMLATADEIWIASSTWEIVPVTQLDDKPVGGGQPGPVWQQALQLYQDYKKDYCQ